MTGVYIDMRNTNALYTVSMLAALIEEGQTNYYDLLAPFILHCLPRKEGAVIDVKDITERMQQEFGFETFIGKMTEKMLDRMCSFTVDGKCCVVRISNRGKASYRVSYVIDNQTFSQTRLSMQERIDNAIKALQDYLEINYICKKVPCEKLKAKLAEFFEEVGFSLATKKVEEIQEITSKDGQYNYAIAKFVLEEHRKGSSVFSSIVEIAKGFMSYKAIYFFTSNNAGKYEQKISSQLKDITFYLDSSLVIDALDYDSEYEYEAIDELIKLIRKAGGRVFVFPHTIEEVRNTIEAFSQQMHHANSFRLDRLSSMHFSREIVAGLAKTVDHDLEKKVDVKQKIPPDITAPLNHTFVLDESSIVSWLTTKRNGRGKSKKQRHVYDAQSLQSISVIRRGSHPTTLERGKAIILTQDPLLNKCMNSLFGFDKRHEIPYAIIDTDLAAYLWVRNYKDSTLPSDILIANAHAACQVTEETINRAFSFAQTMEESGIIPENSSLVVSGCTDFKTYLAEELQGDQESITTESVSAALEKYNQAISSQKVEEARKEEQRRFEEKSALQKKKHLDEQMLISAESDKKDIRIAELEDQLKRRDEEEHRKKQQQINDAETYSQKWARGISIGCYILLAISLCIIACFLAVQAIETIKSDPSICRIVIYSVLGVLSFVGIYCLIIPPKSVVRRLIGRLSGYIQKTVYSKKLDKINSK